MSATSAKRSAALAKARVSEGWYRLSGWLEPSVAEELQKICQREGLKPTAAISRLISGELTR